MTPKAARGTLSPENPLGFFAWSRNEKGAKKGVARKRLPTQSFTCGPCQALELRPRIALSSCTAGAGANLKWNYPQEICYEP